MSLFSRLLVVLALAMISALFMPGAARADVVCTVTQQEVSHYLDAETEICRTSGSHPSSGVMVRMESGPDFVMIDTTYAAGLGPREPSDLHCLEGTCGVGRMDETGEAGDLGEIVACEGDCRAGFSYRDEYDNSKYVELQFTQSSQRLVARLSGRSGPPEMGEMTVDVPGSLAVQRGPFEVSFEFSELARRSDDQPESEGLPLAISGGVLDRTQVTGNTWRVRIVPTQEGSLSMTLDQSSMVGALTGNPLDADYRVMVPIDMTPPSVELVYEGPGQDEFSEIFRFRSSDRTAMVQGTPNVTVSGLQADVLVNADEETVLVTASQAGTASIRVEAGAFVDGAGNTSPASAPLSHEFGNRSVDVTSLTATPMVVPFASHVDLVAELSTSISNGGVSFFVDGSRVGTGAVESGRSELRLPLYTPGNVEITARFDPATTPRLEAGASASVVVEVVKGNPGLAITSAPTTGSVSGEMQIEGTLSEDYSGSLRLEAAFGADPFVAVSSNISRTGNAFVASFTPEAPGSYRLRLVAVETTYFNAETSNEVEVSVDGRSASGSLSLDATEYTVGDRPVILATLTPSDAVGQVAFFHEGVEIGRVSVSAGEASLRAPAVEAAGQAQYGATFLPNPPFTGFEFDPVAASVAHVNANGTLASDKQTYAHGERAMLSATVQPQEATGSVSFFVAGELMATAPIVQGIANAQTEPFDTNGFVDVTARYSGDSRFAAFDFNAVRIEVSTSATSLDVEASTTTPVAGANVTLTARIAPREASGEIIFMADGSEIGRASLSAGSAVMDHTFTRSGQVRITTHYEGNGAYAAAASPELALDVRKQRATGSFATSVPTAEVGEEVLLNVVFGTEGVEGEVEFVANGAVVARASLISGAAETTWSAEAVGTVRLEARYLGNDRFEAVDFDPIDFEVSPRTTEGLVRLDKASYTVGERARAEAEVSPAGATGLVRFAIDGVEVGAASLSGGVAMMELPAWERSGTRTVSAIYEGDTRHAAASLEPRDAEVAKASAFLSFEALGGPFEVGDQATLAVDIVPSNVSGTVTFSVDGLEIGTISPAAGRAEIQTEPLERAGEIMLDARFNGDEGHHASSATPIYIEVARGTAALGLALADGQSSSLLVDDEAELVARLSEAGAGGTLRLMRDGAEVTNAVLNGTEARFTVDTSRAGSFAYQVVYDGDSSLGTAQSGQVLVDVARRAPSLEVSISPAQPNAGTTVQMRATLDAHVDGMVSFENNGRSVGASAVVAGEAVAPLFVSEGDYRLVARFTPDDGRVYDAAASRPLMFSVGKRPLSIAWQTQSPEAAVGETLTLRGSVSDPDFSGEVYLVRSHDDDTVSQLGHVSVSAGQFEFTVSFSEAGNIPVYAEVPASAEWSAASTETLFVRVVAADISGSLEILPARVELDDLAIARLTLSDAGAEGSVAFVDNGLSIGSANVVNGVAEMPLASDRLGQREIEARYSGSSRYNPMSTGVEIFEVVRQQGRFALESDKTEAAVGETVRLTLRSLDHAALSGPASFLTEAALLGSSGMQNGVAFLDVTFAETGEHMIRGRFDGSARVDTAEAENMVAVSVHQAPATLSLSASPAETVVDETVTLTAEIMPPEATGIVRFTGNGDVLGEIALSNGRAVLSHAPAQSGEFQVEAHYLAGGSHASAEAMPVSVWVERMPIELRLSSDAPRYERGSSALLSLVLSRSDASGMAEFFRDGTSIGMATISGGTVSIGVPLEEAGSVSFSALYLGDDRYAPSSTQEPLVVEVEDTQSGRVTLDPLPPEIFVHDGVELTGRAEMPAGETGTGDVVVEIDRGDGFIDFLRAPHETGSWAAGASFDRAGDIAIRARLDGAGADGESLYSTTRSMSVARRATGISLSVSPSEIQPRQEVVMIAELAPSQAAGEVIFYVDTEEAGRAALDAGEASFTTVLSAEGTREIRAEYTGSAAYLASQSPVARVTVGRPDTELSVAGTFAERAGETLLEAVVDITPALDNARVDLIVRYEDEAGSAQEQRVVTSTSGGRAEIEIPMVARPAAGLPVQIEAIFEETDTHRGSRLETTIVAPDWDRLKPTRGVLLVGPDRVAPGETVSMSLTITPPEATGQVVFSSQAGMLGTVTLNDGRALLETSFDEEGRYEISARYEGDSAHEAWQSIETWRVEVSRERTATTASLKGDRTAYAVGDGAELLFEIAPMEATGEVVFEVEGHGVLATVPLSQGQAHAQIDLEQEGHVDVTARYAGDAQFLGSEASLRLSAGRTEVSGILSTSTAEPVRGELVLLSVDLYPAEAVGDVVFRTPSGVIGVAQLEQGRAVLEARFEAPGRYDILASYEGDDSHAAWATPQPVIIEVAETITTHARLEADRSAYDIGDRAQLTFTLDQSRATGEVSFEVEGRGVFATVSVASGIAHAELDLDEAGHLAITARYAGNDQFSASEASRVISTGRVAVSGHFEASSSRVARGQTVGFLVEIDADDASGEVVFRTASGSIGTAELVGGRASIEASFEEAGRYEIFAAYEGDETYAAWTAASPLSVEVVEGLIETRGLLTSDQEVYQIGDRADLTFEVFPADAMGEVVFEAEGHGVFATVPLASGRAQAGLDMDRKGHVVITARYLGSEQHSGSEARVILSTGRMAVSGDFTASANRIATNDLVEFRVEISPEAATGEVVFSTATRVIGVAELASGRATLEAVFDREGRHEVFAQYRGDGSFAAWAAPAPVEVEVVDDLIETSAHLEADAASYAVGDVATFAFEVFPSSATGNVVFDLEGQGVFATVSLVEGRAEAELELTRDGHFNIVARYAGDARHLDVQSETMVSAGRVAVSGNVSLDKSSYEAGETAVLLVEMQPVDVAGDVVLLVDGVETERRALDGARAEFSTEVPSSGVSMLRVRYEGSAAHAAWLSDEIGLRSGARQVAMQLAALATHAAPGENVSFRLTLEPAPETGAVEIEANGAMTRTLRLSGQSEYVFDLVMPDAGDLQVVAHFDGADGYPATASSEVIVEHSDRASSTVSLRLSDGDPRDGDTITLTGEVEPNAATGEVVFEVNGAEVARAPLSAGRADAIWTVGAGEQRIVARYLGDEIYQASRSEAIVLSVRPLALDLFEERRAFIEEVMAAEAERANSARARGFERRMEGVRERLRGETGQGVPRDAEVARAGWSSGAWEPFRYEGDIRATDGFAHGDGAFSSRRSLGSTGLEQFVDGGFEVTRRSDLGTSFEGAVNTGIEKRISEDTIVGASVGLEMAQTAVDSEMKGEMQTLGVNAGVYGAKRIASDVVVDGYANVARTQHAMDLADDELSAASTYGATSVQVGGSISGRYEIGRTEFLPAVTLRHSMTARDRADVELQARTGPATGQVEGRISHETRVEVVPEMRFHSRRENGPMLSVKPKVICEREETTECGVGIGAGVEVPVAQGRGKLKAEVSVEQVGDEVEEKIFFGFEIKF